MTLEELEKVSPNAHRCLWTAMKHPYDLDVVEMCLARAKELILIGVPEEKSEAWRFVHSKLWQMERHARAFTKGVGRDLAFTCAPEIDK